MLKVPSAKRLSTGRNVALPAAVFNRSPMKRSKISQNSCNINLSSDRSYTGQGPVCFNHKNKHAKFYMVSQQDQQIIDYCQKCAILLASQGFKVNRYQQINMKGSSIIRSRVVEEPIKPTREQQLQAFIKLTTKKIGTMQGHLSVTEKRLNEVNNSYDSNQTRIQSFFKGIFEGLQKQRQVCLQKAKYERQSLQKSSKANIEYLRQKISLLKSMVQDIDDSFDSIVKQTPQEDYMLVMEHYKNCLDQIKQKQPHSDLHLPFLPSVQNMESVISEYIMSNDNAAHFSFDQSSKRPF